MAASSSTVAPRLDPAVVAGLRAIAERVESARLSAALDAEIDRLAVELSARRAEVRHAWPFAYRRVGANRAQLRVVGTAFGLLVDELALPGLPFFEFFVPSAVWDGSDLRTRDDVVGAAEREPCPGRIWLHAGLEGAALAGTVAHEARHLAQREWDDAAEVDARRYEAEFVHRHARRFR